MYHREKNYCGYNPINPLLHTVVQEQQLATLSIIKIRDDGKNFLSAASMSRMTTRTRAVMGYEAKKNNGLEAITRIYIS